MAIQYKNQDQRSKCIRGLDNSAAHYFLCHNDNPKDCDGGATCSADNHRLSLYNKAYEEVFNDPNPDD